MDYSYAIEKLRLAVESLVRDAPLADRLDNAWTSALIRLEPGDFPPECGSENFPALMSLLTEMRNPQAGTARATALTEWMLNHDAKRGQTTAIDGPILQA
jgi:hypothetical protein